MPDASGGLIEVVLHHAHDNLQSVFCRAVPRAGESIKTPDGEKEIVGVSHELVTDAAGRSTLTPTIYLSGAKTGD